LHKANPTVHYITLLAFLKYNNDTEQTVSWLL